MNQTIVKPTFIWKFKTGDNIAYNLSVLKTLYLSYEKLAESDGRDMLYKPMLLIIISIIEASLQDFDARVRGAVREGVDPLTDDILEEIQSKQYTKFDHYIACAKKHDLFDVEYGDDRESFYTSLKKLQTIRNRIHIQNEKCYDPIEESEVYTEANKDLAERALEYTLKFLDHKFPRFERKQCFVRDFILPWESKIGTR